MGTTDIGVLAGSLMQGRVVLDASVLKQLRHSRQLSQDELANECSRRHFRVSISSIKRAETGRPVLFRIARELARFYDVPPERLMRYEERNQVDALSIAEKALNLDGPITASYELSRLKGLLLKLLGLPEKSIPYLLETVGLACDDCERCQAWCELADAYLCVNRRAEAESAIGQAERYAASSGNSGERRAHIDSLRRSLGGEGGVEAM